MYEVRATYPDGKELTFFEDWGLEEAERNAQLAHPKQTKPSNVDLQPIKLDGSWHFYSVEFDYSVPDTARPKHFSGGGLHISFAHDEREASRRLDAAMNTVAVAALRAQIRNVSQYAWPDGSLYYWFASPLPEKEFKAKELKRFEEELERVSLHPFKLVRYYKDGKKKRAFTHAYGESRVKISQVREKTSPYRYDPHKCGCLHLVDLFNGFRYLDHGSAKHEGSLVVPEKEAESFQEGVEVAYEHQNLFTPYAAERRSPEELQAFAWGYYLARVLQLLTE